MPTHTQPASLPTKHVNKHREVHTELEADHVEETIARAQLRNERRVAQVKLTQHRAELSAFQRARYAAESLRVGYTAANMASDILARKAPQVPEPAQLPKPEREQSPVEEEWNRHQASEVDVWAELEAARQEQSSAAATLESTVAEKDAAVAAAAGKIGELEAALEEAKASDTEKEAALQSAQAELESLK